MTYNIYRGFHSKKHVFEPERLALAQQIVVDENPDVLCLTEACYGGLNKHGISMEYQNLFKFPFGCWGGYNKFNGGDEGGNCLLSKYPFQAEVVAIGEKGAIRGRINLDDKVLHLDVVHPSVDWSDADKLVKMQPLLSSREMPYVMTGDFNALSPQDHYDREHLVWECRRFEGSNAEAFVDDLLQRNFVTEILAWGLRDGFENPVKRVSTVPTRMKYGEALQGMRIDYFFISKDISVEDAYVLKNDKTDCASDHYPICAIVTL